MKCGLWNLGSQPPELAEQAGLSCSWDAFSWGNSMYRDLSRTTRLLPATGVIRLRWQVRLVLGGHSSFLHKFQFQHSLLLQNTELHPQEAVQRQPGCDSLMLTYLKF